LRKCRRAEEKDNWQRCAEHVKQTSE
jgi:hypothetical protein